MISTGIPLDDEKTYRMLGRGEAVGVFQVESGGMRKALVDMRADRFEDLIALVALYRPGPMANIPAYCACIELGEENVEYVPIGSWSRSSRRPSAIIAYPGTGAADRQGSTWLAIPLRRPTSCAGRWARRSRRRWMRNASVSSAAQSSAASPKPTCRRHFRRLRQILRRLRLQQVAMARPAISPSSPTRLPQFKADHPAEFLAASMTLDMGNTDKPGRVPRAEAQRLGIKVVAPSIVESLVWFDVRVEAGLPISTTR